jgi:hypothetical protein
VAKQANAGNTIQIVLSIVGFFALLIWVMSADSSSALLFRIFVVVAAVITLMTLASVMK